MMKKTRGMFNADDRLWQSFEKEKHKNKELYFCSD